MPELDLSLEELHRYRAQVRPPRDLRAFWEQSLAETDRHDLAVSVNAVDSGLVTVDTFDVSFAGFGGDRVRAWLHLPAAELRDDSPLPAVAQFQGYNGGRGLPHEHVYWASAGYAHLVVDTRGQGSGWTVGDTGDPGGTGPSQPGFLTRGIEDPATYYYRRVYVDAVRAVAALREHPLVDERRVAVTGASQGGGISLAVAALVPDLVAVMPDVPFLCDFRRATRVAPGEPYGELVRYLAAHRERVDAAFETLAYFDGAALAGLASAPALFSVALMDPVCPPSTVFAAYHAYAGPKDLAVYEFNEHEGGEAFQHDRQRRWLAERLAP